MKTDEARRQAVARGWAATSFDQAAYAAQHGISTRTLREWVRKYGAGERPMVRAVAIIDSTISQLQAMRAALVAEVACHAGGVASHDDGGKQQEDERRAGSEGPAEAKAAVEQEPIRPSPMPTPRFDWY